ncbi:DUF1983 domain-containing protein [Salinispirillum sp. LH 10-3-1]|uniref:DUF1983 domain-containing protein n=1 Tax=Salinispirillum sp. LH 10-3-1 TaxID=2952525 RepID=A0AB38YDC6_9GAMM
MSRSRRKSLPPIPRTIDPQTRAWMEAVKEQLDVGQGTRGNTLDTNLTYGDLIDIGVAKFKTKFSGGLFNSSQLVPVDQVIDRTIPPRPDGVYGAASIGANTLIWTDPFRQYRNHSHAEVLRAEGEDSLPGEAVKIGTANGSIYSDFTPQPGVFYRYWVRFVSRADITGPIHSSVGLLIETAIPAAVMIEAISGQIDESVLAGSLNQRINLIDGPDSLEGSVASIIKVESQARVEQDNVLSQQINTLASQVNSNLSAIQTESQTRATQNEALALQINTVYAQSNENASAIQTESQTRATQFNTLAQQITTVQSEFEDETAAIQQTLTTQGSAVDGLTAQWEVKSDVNGLVGGVGFFNNGETVDFGIVADRLWITPPNGTGMLKPFIIQDGAVYMNVAVIKEGSIDEGRIGPINFGKIVDSEGQPVTTLAGQLKAEQISTENMTISETATFLGNLDIKSASSGERLQIKNSKIQVFNEDNNLVLVLGNLTE